MFDREFVKQFAGLGSNAAMAKMPVPRTAPRYMDYEQAGEYIRRTPVEAIRACVRAGNACGLRRHVEHRGWLGRVSLVVAAVRVPTGREFDHDRFHAVVSMTTRRRRPW